MSKIINKFKFYGAYILRFLFSICGYDWKVFYTWLLNKIEKKNNFLTIKKQKRKHGFYSLESGNKDLNFLIKHGLKKSHSFLDYGCGYGRTAIPVINFLKEKKYTGLDLSKERIRIAQEYLKDESLEYKMPKFIVSIDKNLKDILKNQTFDIIFIYTVMVHNPIKEVKNILQEVEPFLSKGGKIFVDYWNPIPEESLQSVKDYRIKKADMEKILLEIGYNFIDIEDFINFQPNKISSKYHRMLCLEKE